MKAIKSFGNIFVLTGVVCIVCVLAMSCAKSKSNQAGAQNEEGQAVLGKAKLYKRRVLDEYSSTEGYLGDDNIIQSFDLDSVDTRENGNYDVDISPEEIVSHFSMTNADFVIVGIGFEGKRDGWGVHINFVAEIKSMLFVEGSNGGSTDEE